MDVKITEVPSKNGQKIYYTFEWGKGPGERKATGRYTWAKPKNQIQKNYNKEQLQIIQQEQAQRLIDMSSIGTQHVPSHRFKANFLDFYADYVKENENITNRAIRNSYNSFKKFIKKQFLSPTEITENLCERFRKYLLDNLNGETPANYFSRFKKVIKAAYKQGYFTLNIAEDIKAKANPRGIKDILSHEEYRTLINTYCTNYEVKKAAVVSMYTGLRWCDIKKLTWVQIRQKTIVLRKQSKTKFPLEIPLHPVVKAIIGERKTDDRLVFQLPSADGANKILSEWVNKVNPEIHITWHCLRHSVSDIMQSAGIHVQTVAAVLGQTTVKHLLERYTKRVRQGETAVAMDVMPDYAANINFEMDE